MRDTKQRRRRPCCPRCLHPDYKQGVSPGDGRPQFVCVRCDNTWTAGTTGGEYIKPLTSGAQE